MNKTMARKDRRAAKPRNGSVKKYTPRPTGSRVPESARARLRQRVYEVLRGHDGPLSTADLLERLGGGTRRTVNRELLDHLIAEGWVEALADGRVTVRYAVGELRMNQRGFGFVVGPLEGDVFVPARWTHGAWHGDQVEVWWRPRPEGPGPEGEVMAIPEQAPRRMVARLDNTRGVWRAVPSDARLPEVRVSGSDLVPGDLVVVEWVARTAAGVRGRVVERLGASDAPGQDVRRVMAERNLPTAFPAAVMIEAEALGDRVRTEDLRDREDLTGRLIVTIDGADAKDLDDAISVERHGRRFEVGVHIADVSHYVREGSWLDREARQRGTSVYLVDRVIPMLPPALSNGLASLNAAELRLTVSAFVTVAADGTPVAARFSRSFIRTRARLTYEGVNRALAGDPGDLTDLVPWLTEAEQLAGRLHAARVRRGAVDFDLPEAKIHLDDQGRPVSVTLRERGPAERLIEEFMLLANEAVARQLVEAELPGLYRVHEPPTEEKLEDLRTLIAALGHRLPTPVTPMALQRLLTRVAGRPEARLVTEATLRSMRQARYGPDNLGHFGLAAEHYTHFTSPIRRYPDLFVHRVLKAWLTKSGQAEDFARWRAEAPAVGELASERERAAMEAERDSVAVKQVQFMVDKLGERFSGLVSGVTSFGLFVELPTLIEGLLRIDSLPPDRYTHDPVHHTLTGTASGVRYRLGDPLDVVVARVDVPARRIDFALAPPLTTPTEARPPAPPKKRRRRPRLQPPGGTAPG